MRGATPARPLGTPGPLSPIRGAPTDAAVPAPSGVPQSSASHIPALDGMRGIACALVVLNHYLDLGGRATPGERLLATAHAGWVGVDLFFVLSGFLITGGLLASRGRDGYFRRFYIRRALRIWPLYYAVLLLLVPMMPLVWAPDAAAYRALASTPWLWVHAVNWLVAARGTFTAVPAVVGNLWSLAVEEQFYAVWPVVVLVTGLTRLRHVCAALILTSTVLRIVMAAGGATPIAHYTMLVTRLDGLAVGAWLAIAARDPVQWAALARTVRPLSAAPAIRLATMGLGAWTALIATGTGYTGLLMRTVGYTALALAFGGLLVAAMVAPPSSALSRLTNAPALRWLGGVSYSVYIFHQPVQYALAHAGIAPKAFPAVWGSHVPAVFAAATVWTAATLLLAWASWRWFERPILAWKDRLAP